jgi:hypothetical protein
MKDLEIIYAMLSEKHSLDTSYRKVLFLGTGNKNINEIVLSLKVFVV